MVPVVVQTFSPCCFQKKDYRGCGLAAGYSASALDLKKLTKV